ncbi:MAG: hypothetical protein EBT83_10040 [Betaproteobacteria bacterium]|nr:hypothetical protein [Betaproteobacteria bacterium]
MTHAEFVAGCRAGAVDPRIDTIAAARHLNARLMLPLVRLPVLGTGVALALIGWILTGLAIIALGILLPRLVALSAPQIILDEALASESRFHEFIAAGIIDPL